jgi:putative PEP-CTERM system histidine kinase
VTDLPLANAALWSYGLGAAGFGAFALRLALGWRESARATLLLAVTLISMLWAASGVATVLWPSPRTWAAAVVFDTLRYAIWFAFLVSVLKGAPQDRARASTQPAMPHWFVALFVILLLATVVLSDGRAFFAVAERVPATWAFGARLGLAIFGLVLVEQLLRRATQEARWAIRPLCIGLAGLFAFDLFFYADAMLFGRLDADIWAARGIANATVIPFIALATARNPRWTIELHMSRSVVFHSTALLVSGAFLLAVAAAGYFVRYFGGEWGRAIEVVVSFAALLVAAFVGSSGGFRAKLRVFVSKHFFSYRYDYREEWLRFTRMLSTESSPLHSVQERTIMALANLVESPGGALWLRQERGFRQVARCNMPAIGLVEPADGSLAQFLTRTGWVVNVVEYAAGKERPPGVVLPEWLSDVRSAWLIVPLLSGTELVGYVILANPRTEIEVNWEVLDLLKTAGRQAASFLGHTAATERLLESSKFDAFNRMSAFVVHDLKNLVAQLSLMLSNAERHRDNPEFQRDMLTTVEHVVGRMYHLMLQLRTEGAPVEKAHVTQLETVVRRVCATKSIGRTPILLDIQHAATTVGHEDRLDHVIGHLVQNALDATRDGGSVTVRLGREGPHALLEVVDTGVGMTPEFVRDRLFKPFETTKPDGMGIGMYESRQYVMTLGGEIVVDSAPGKGTRIRVLLPAGDGATSGSAPSKVAA